MIKAVKATLSWNTSRITTLNPEGGREAFGFSFFTVSFFLFSFSAIVSTSLLNSNTWVDNTHNDIG